MKSRRCFDHWLAVLTVAFSAFSAAALVLEAVWQPPAAAASA